jgi:tetratricopeptide (TPR) repeat protein
VGEDIPPAPQDLKERFDPLLDAAIQDLADNPNAAVKSLRTALAMDDLHARGHFLLGRALTATGEHEAALTEYTRARDLDRMPWRAPSSANQAVRDVAAQGAILCDMEAAFRRESPGGAIGWELMDDHVHMTLRGQHLFALTIAQEMSRLPPPLDVDAGRLAELPGWSDYADRLGRNPFDDYAVSSRLRKLFNIPFLKRSNPEARERFESACAELLAGMTESDRRAAEQWHDPDLHVSNDRPITFVVGYHRMMAGDFAGAAPLFETARRCVCSVSLWRLQLDWYRVNCARHLRPTLTEADQTICREAIEVGELLNRFVGFRDPLGPSYLGLAYHFAGDDRAAVTCLEPVVRWARGKEGADVVQALAGSLIRMGQGDRARLLLDRARQDPAMAEMAAAMLSGLNAIRPADPPTGP